MNTEHCPTSLYTKIHEIDCRYLTGTVKLPRTSAELPIDRSQIMLSTHISHAIPRNAYPLILDDVWLASGGGLAGNDWR